MADVAVKRFDELESYQNQFLYAGRGSHRCRARPDGLVLGVYVAPQLTAPGAALLLAIFRVIWLMVVHTAYDTFAVAIEFSEEGLVRRGMFGRGATHPWSRVGRVRKGEESGLGARPDVA